MKTYIAIFAVLALCCIVNAQFDHVVFNGQSLSLSQQASGVNGHQEFSATVSDSIPGGKCQINQHAVSSVQTNNGPFNSGTYYRVALVPTNSGTFNATLMVSLSQADEVYPICDDSSCTSATEFSCDGASCFANYYCDIYNDANTLTVTIYAEKGDLDLTNNYQLTVTQYTETVNVIDTSSRTITVTGSNPTNQAGISQPQLPPSNFQHFYHDLEATYAEQSSSSRMLITANGFATAASSQTVYLCVALDHIAALDTFTGIVSSTGFNPDTDSNPFTTPLNSPNGCQVYCAAGDSINGVTLAIDSCQLETCGFPEDMWIGVVPATEQTSYTVSVGFRSLSIPELVTVNSANFMEDGQVTDTGYILCDGEQGNFGCNNYYLANVANAGNPSFTDSRVGPYLSVEVYGAFDGSVTTYLSDSYLLGSESACPGCAALETCTSNDNPGTGEFTDCYLMRQPCQWNTDNSNDWLVSVEGANQIDSSDITEYGINVVMNSYPLETVTVSDATTPSIATIKPRHYHHYQVTFTDADLFDDSYFAVELYTNHAEEHVEFMWNYGSIADANECYTNQGWCRTADDNVGQCRFLFIGCPIEQMYSNYLSTSGLDSSNGMGLKVAELQAGTYYFAVRGVNQQYDNFGRETHFTINWNLQRSVPIYDGVTSLQHVYFLDYTPQYYIDLPADGNIRGLQIRISEVTGGVVTAYAKCAELAGTCPCFTSDATCTAGSNNNAGTPNSDCSVEFNTCECIDERVYVSVVGTAPGASTTSTSVDGSRSIGFAMTAMIQYYDEEIYSAEITALPVSRFGTTVTDTITQYNMASDVANNGGDSATPAGFECCNQYRFYELDFTNLDYNPGFDALSLTLKYVPEHELESDSAETTDSPSVTMYVAQDRLGGNSNQLCSWEYTCTATQNDVSGNNEVLAQTNGSPTGYAYCNIVIQPCTAGASCVNQQMKTNTVPSGFDASNNYYITIVNNAAAGLDTTANNDQTVDFTLTAMVLDYTPVPLSDGVPIHAYVLDNAYQHFSFALPSLAANDWLSVSFYDNRDVTVTSQINYYLNYVATGDDVVLAGPMSNCYSQVDACEACVTNPATSQYYCEFEVTPCELKGQTGTYYISAISPNQVRFDQEPQFTIKAAIQSISELITLTDGGLPAVDNLFETTSTYYSVTLPPLTDASQSIVGRALSIDVESAVEGDIFVTITKISPEDQCDCKSEGHEVDNTVTSPYDDINWKRYPCELQEGDVYYIAVDADQDTINGDPVSFVIHTRLQNVIEASIPLVSATSSINANVIQNGTLTNAVVARDDIRTYSFTPDATAGNVVAIEVTQADNIFNNQRPISIWVSRGTFATPSGSNDDASGNDVGPDPQQFTCPSVVYTNCVAAQSYYSGATCQIAIDPCDLNGEEWYVTILGEDLPLTTSSQAITIDVRVIAPTTGLAVPATTGSANSATTTGLTRGTSIEFGFGNSVYQTNQLSIAAGQHANFVVNGPSAFAISRGSVCTSTFCSASNCDIYACNALSDNYFIRVIGSTTSSTTDSVTITLENAPTENTLTIQGNLNENTNITATGLEGTNGDIPASYRYYSFSVTGSDQSEYDVLYTGALSSNDFFAVASPFFLPGFTAGSNQVTAFSDGTYGTTCGALLSVSNAGRCCYDAVSQTIVAVGNNNQGDYNVEVEVTDFNDESSDGTISSGNQISGTVTNGQVDWRSINVSPGQHMYVDYQTTGATELYVYKGGRSGSGSTVSSNSNDDYGYCYPSIGLMDLSGFCDSQGDCQGFLENCESCLTDSQGGEFFFGIVPTNPSDTQFANYTLLVVLQDASQAFSSSISATFPVSTAIVDSVSSQGQYAPYSFYTYTYNTAIQSINNWIPTPSDLNTLLNRNKVTFRIDNVRGANNGEPSVFPLDVYMSGTGLPSSSSTGCLLSGQNLADNHTPFACLENNGGADVGNDNLTCSVDICEFSCGATYFFGIGRDSADSSTDRYTFTLSATEDYDDILNDANILFITDANVNQGTQTFQSSSFTNGGTNTGNIGFVRFDATSLAGSYYDITFATTGSNNLQISSYTLDGCSTVANEATINSNTDLFFRADPCQNLRDTATFETIYRIENNNGVSSDFNFTITVNTNSYSVIDASETTLSSDNPTYTKTKEIVNNQWHFYDIDVPNPQYNQWLSVDISEICCIENGADMEFYYSWKATDDDDLTINEWPVRVPSPTCHGTGDVLNLGGVAENDIGSFCLFRGGSYQISVYLPRDSQLYDLANDGVDFPGLYTIDVQLNTMPVTQIAQECHYDVDPTATGYNGRYITFVEAANRGERVTFALECEDVTCAGTTLMVSKNLQPFDRNVNDICNWGTATTGVYTDEFGDYQCTATATGCEIDIPECEFDDGWWNIYVSNPPAGVFHLGSHVDVKYIPLLTDSVNTLTGLNTQDFYQYYKVQVDPTSDLSYLTAIITDMSCDDADCAQTMFIQRGVSGLAANNTGITNNLAIESCDGSCGVNCDCSYDSCSTSSTDNDCGLTMARCGYERNQFYLGVRRLTNTNSQCKYQIDVQTEVQNVETVDLNIETCSTVDCRDYWLVNGGPFTESTITVTFSGDVTVWYGNGNVGFGNGCNDASASCTAGSTCTLTVQCVSDLTYLTFVENDDDEDQSDCDVCGGTEYAFSVSVAQSTFETITANGVAATSSLAVYAHTAGAFTYTNSDVAYSKDVFGTSTCTTTCTTSRLLNGFSTGGNYYFNGAVGLELETATATTLSTNPQTVTYVTGDYMKHFQIDVPATSSSYTVYITNVEYCACDSNDIGGIGLHYRVATGQIPFDGCFDCTGGTNLVGGSCDASAAPISGSCAAGDTIYLTLSACSAISACDVVFDIHVEFSDDLTSITGTDHTAAFTTWEYDAYDCGAVATPQVFTVEVTDILSVTIRDEVNADVSVMVANCADSTSCSIDSVATEDDGENLSCRVDSDDCDIYFSCVTPGTYYITLTPSPNNIIASFDYQVVTQYVALASSASATISGAHRHFYQYDNQQQSAVINLDVVYGVLSLAVHDGCTFTNAGTGFYEFEVCENQDCMIALPTTAKHSLASTFYIVVSSKDNVVGDDNDGLDRMENFNTEKESSYVLTVTTGDANCAAPPTTGFCADATREGINVWSSITNNVWSNRFPDFADNQAECLFEELTEEFCPAPTDACRQALKVFACVDSFPQCSATGGFQMGMCQDICNMVEEACGAWTNIQPHFEYQCMSGRYQEGSTGSCYTFPNVTDTYVPVETVETESIQTEFTLDVPVFSTVYVELPPAGDFGIGGNNDDDDDDDTVDPDTEEPTVEVDDDDSASTLSALFAVVALFAIHLALFF